MELTSSKNCVLEALCSSVELMEWEALGKARATGPLALAALARAGARALLRPAAPPAKRLAARLLRRLAAPLVLDDGTRPPPRPSALPALSNLTPSPAQRRGSACGATTAPPMTTPSTNARSSRWTTSTTPSRSCTISSRRRSAQWC